MHFLTCLLTGTVIFLLVCSSPSVALPSATKCPDVETHRHIVKFRNAAAKVNALRQLSAEVRSAVTHEWEIIPGIAGEFDNVTLENLRHSRDVEYVEEDGIARLATFTDQFIMTLDGDQALQPGLAPLTQVDAPWGLARLKSAKSLAGSNASALDFQYPYHEPAGAGVDVYLIDTGVMITHSEFGGRARWGKTFMGNNTSHPPFDDNGHGTHCAGIIAGSRFGVAKRASIISVKVVDCHGQGYTADIVSGINWAAKEAALTGRPSIVSMSLGVEQPSKPLDDAVDALADRGIHPVAAAGNSNRDAANTSPARMDSVITVAAMTIEDTKASFSNYGASVNIWAPGKDITSSWIKGDRDFRSMSGTSVAAPHVSGLIAYLISLDGNVSPKLMKKKLQQWSLKNRISGVPHGTVNYLAYSTR